MTTVWDTSLAPLGMILFTTKLPCRLLSIPCTGPKHCKVNFLFSWRKRSTFPARNRPVHVPPYPTGLLQLLLLRSKSCFVQLQLIIACTVKGFVQFQPVSTVQMLLVTAAVCCLQLTGVTSCFTVLCRLTFIRENSQKRSVGYTCASTKVSSCAFDFFWFYFSV